MLLYQYWLREKELRKSLERAQKEGAQKEGAKQIRSVLALKEGAQGAARGKERAARRLPGEGRGESNI